MLCVAALSPKNYISMQLNSKHDTAAVGNVMNRIDYILVHHMFEKAEVARRR